MARGRRFPGGSGPGTSLAARGAAGRAVTGRGVAQKGWPEGRGRKSVAGRQWALAGSSLTRRAGLPCAHLVTPGGRGGYPASSPDVGSSPWPDLGRLPGPLGRVGTRPPCQDVSVTFVRRIGWRAKPRAGPIPHLDRSPASHSPRAAPRGRRAGGSALKARTGQPRSWASRRSARSGFTAWGWPTASSIGRSVIESL